MRLLLGLYVSLSVLFSTTAQAGIMLEPYAGYAMSTFTGKNATSGADTKTTDNGIALGARLGYALPLGLWFAADYFYQPQTTYKWEQPSGLTDDKSNRDTLFVDVGFNLPAIPLRFWGGYGVTNNQKIESTSGSSTSTGTALKAGIGFKPIPLLSVNFEYIKHEFTKVKTDTAEYDADRLYTGTSSSTLFLSFSVPLSF